MQTVPVFDSLTGKIIGYEQRLVKSADGTISLGKATDKTADGLKKLADETKRASDNQEKWNQEVAKMDFAAKIKMIESATQIAVASIEADAKKTVAAFESINNTITVTTKSITEMFGIMAAPNAMDWSTYKNIQNQISTENKLRQDAFDLQKKLTEAQIDMMKAQTKALTNGEGLIKIDGAGLMVAHDDGIGAHGVERHRRVEQGFALAHGGGGDVHVDDVGPEPLGGDLEARPRARRVLEEQVHDRPAGEPVAPFVDGSVLVDVGFR